MTEKMGLEPQTLADIVMHLDARQVANQLAIQALVASHPDPAAFADQLATLSANQQIAMTVAGVHQPLHRQELRARVQSFLDIASSSARAARGSPPTS